MCHILVLAPPLLTDGEVSLILSLPLCASSPLEDMDNHDHAGFPRAT